MTDHAIILSMIERVDPSDSAALDEIDLAVEFYLLGEIFPRDESGRRRSKQGWHVAETVRYTRSRDMLKAIRPEGWEFDMMSHEGTYQYYGAGDDGEVWSPANPSLGAEELAELHAIIQAIACERARE